MATSIHPTSARGEQDDLIPFYVDDQPGLWREAGAEIVYNRHIDEVLGDDVSDDEDSKDSRRCFNCGSLQHAVSACTDPINHQLVSLSRQLYNFFKGDHATDFLRIHELGEWKRERVQWLERFEPGDIRGPLLREALGLEGTDNGQYVEWLANIALWGYPRGWVGHSDPRHRVWEIIDQRTGDADLNVEDESPLLFIHGEQEDPEEVLLPSCVPRASSTLYPNPDADETSVPRRWAQYPETYFSSSLLPIYNGFTLPPVGSHHSEQSHAFSSDRQTLGSDTTGGDDFKQPPPLTPPPPLPLTLPSLPSHSSMLRPPHTATVVHDGELDMDLSDSD
ncbi:hypothetical protein BC835DRAFT_356243 [Cytidiella melzeri]|nr:hypothetical protein BC835DRAFT_356243 [Cytidiella melzeri]